MSLVISRPGKRYKFPHDNFKLENLTCTSCRPKLCQDQPTGDVIKASARRMPKSNSVNLHLGTFKCTFDKLLHPSVGGGGGGNYSVGLFVGNHGRCILASISCFLQYELNGCDLDQSELKPDTLSSYPQSHGSTQTGPGG